MASKSITFSNPELQKMALDHIENRLLELQSIPYGVARDITLETYIVEILGLIKNVRG